MAAKFYEETIWTNHALERLEQRGLPQHMAYETFKHPDRSFKVKDGALEYIKMFGKQKVTVIAKQNESSEWIIISCFLDPPNPGTLDEKKKNAYHAYQKMGFWGRLWVDIKRDFFGMEY